MLNQRLAVAAFLDAGPKADLPLSAKAGHHPERELDLLEVAYCGSLPGEVLGCLPRRLRFSHSVHYRLMRLQYPPKRGFPFVSRLRAALVHFLDLSRHLLGRAR